MKSTPDVPPALAEIVAELREIAVDAADEAQIQHAGGHQEARAGDAVVMAFQHIDERLTEIAKRLEGIALDLAKPWPKTK